jgi:predicted nucleic-acid-binding Zn-ribbon protein
MDTHPCPKCNEALDEGRISMTGSDYLAYLSNKQTGMIRTATNITKARACPNCGYVEFYLDPKELKSRLS